MTTLEDGETTTSDFLLPMVPSTLQDAVNTLVACVSEGPYSQISPSPSPEVDKALVALNEANRDVQSRGWDWNREYGFPLTLAPDQTCPVPANCYRVAAAYYTATNNTLGLSANGYPTKFTKRGSLLYDQINHTFAFTQGIAPCVDMILILSWDLIPESARRLITYIAAQKYISREQMSGVTMQVNAKDMMNAWTVIEQEEDEVNQHNAIHGNLHTRVSLYGEGSLRRNRSGLD